MYPILISIGPISIYTAHLFAIIAWCIFSFIFWKILRSQGVLEERIFDLTFYSTLFGIIIARIGFVFLYPQLFMSSVLLIGAFWIQPGLWLFSGLLGVLLTLYIFSKRYNIRFSFVFDAFVCALPWTLIPIALGAFAGGYEPGRVSSSAWSIIYPGLDGARHPVSVYEIIVYMLIGILSVFLYKKATKDKWPHGLLGALILTLFLPALFVLEFFKEGSLYLYGITINQWILILLFAESFGTLLIKMKRMGIFSRKKGVQHEEPVTTE